MTYEFTVTLTINDFKRLLSWGNKDKKFDTKDKKLASKIEFILEDMIEEDRIIREDEAKEDE